MHVPQSRFPFRDFGAYVHTIKLRTFVGACILFARRSSALTCPSDVLMEASSQPKFKTASLPLPFTPVASGGSIFSCRACGGMPQIPVLEPGTEGRLKDGNVLHVGLHYIMALSVSFAFSATQLTIAPSGHRCLGLRMFPKPTAHAARSRMLP